MSQTELSEEDLLQRAGRGDSRAFDQLYDRMAPRLFGLLRQMLHDEREAEDILQDGFVLLWERASTFEAERSKAFTWAVMLFRHKARRDLAAPHRTGDAMRGFLGPILHA